MTPLEPAQHPAQGSAATATRMSVRCTEDLIAVVPIVLGFVPTDSVVLLTFGGRAFHARCDLPPRDDPQALEETVATLVDPARRHGIEQAAVVTYTADRSLGSSVAGALERRLSRAGIEVLDLVRVAEGRWFPARGRRAGVLDRGVPFDASTHPFAAQAVLDGRVQMPSREALAATLLPLWAHVAAVDAAAPDSSASGPVSDEPPEAEMVWAATLVAHHAEAGTVPSATDLARLLDGLTDLRIRDAVWVMIPPHGQGDSPRRAVAWWTEVVRRSPARWRAPAAALLAFAAWNLGDGALSWCAIDVARAADPHHTLTEMVAGLLARAVPPDVWDTDWLRPAEPRH